MSAAACTMRLAGLDAGACRNLPSLYVCKLCTHVPAFCTQATTQHHPGEQVLWRGRVAVCVALTIRHPSKLPVCSPSISLPTTAPQVATYCSHKGLQHQAYTSMVL